MTLHAIVLAVSNKVQARGGKPIFVQPSFCSEWIFFVLTCVTIVWYIGCNAVPVGIVYFQRKISCNHV